MGKEPTEVTGTVIAETLKEIFSTLIAEGIITPFGYGLPSYLNPGQTLTTILPIPSYQVYIIAQSRSYVDTDHAFSVVVTFDTTEVLNDPDICQANYDTPIDFLDLALIPAYKQIVITMTNNSASIAYSTDLIIGGWLSRDDFKLLIANYFKVITQDIGIEPQAIV